MLTYDEAHTKVVNPSDDTTEDVPMAREVRQGDPLSLILYSPVLVEAYRGK